LGEGTSARTLLCRDRQDEREVALKELRVQHLDDWKHLELFEREAKVLAGLRHHAIPQVFDTIEHQGESDAEPSGPGVLILVQEFIEGLSLAQRMEDGPTLGQVELFQLTLGVLDVLEYLHGRSPPIYHRDIKPSNIIVRPTGAPVLVDFGSVTHGWRPATAAGSTVTGTFGYMPPEQLLGQVGPTSDLYALGATLLHVMTGRDPTDFPFDSGRIEVPADLPASPPLRALVTALLEPAPNNRPRSVADARAIALGHSRETADAPSTALVPMRSGPPALVGGDGPRFVDVGPPPRDPEGEFADVYKLLTEPFNPLPRTHGALRTLTTVGMWGLFVCTLGILPAIYYSDRAARRKRHDAVFRTGLRANGTLVGISGDPNANMYATLSYEFMAGEVKCRGFAQYPHSISKFLAIGDRVCVLYLAENPERCAVVFRPRSTRNAARA